MISMSTIWDRSTEVIAGRAGMLATIAGLLTFLPAVVQAAYGAYMTPTGPVTAASMAALGGGMMVMGLIVIVFALWSSLSLVAASSDPNVHSATMAMAIGGRRLPVAIGLSLLLGVGAVLLFVPIVLLLVASGIDFTALARGNAAGAVTGSGPAAGAILGVAVYVLLLLVFALWLSARLFLFAPVIVNERLGLASIARSFRLTRGLTLRIIGITLLFFLVAMVASAAAQAVLGLIARLVLGSNSAGTVRFVGQVAGGLVNAAFGVVYATYTAQLYRTVTGREAAEAFG